MGLFDFLKKNKSEEELLSETVEAEDMQSAADETQPDETADENIDRGR